MEPKLIYLVSALATIFPGMSGDEYVRLKDSIRNLGLLEDITLWRGMVVDGYHRLRACLELGIEPSFHHLPGDAIPLEYVAGKNASRRHMSTGQRAVVAFRASRLSAPGRPRETGENCANLRSYMTQGQAASLFGISRRSVSSMARILGPESTAAPELRRAVLSGQLTASDANSVLGEPEDVQRRAVELVLRGECQDPEERRPLNRRRPGRSRRSRGCRFRPTCCGGQWNGNPSRRAAGRPARDRRT